MRIYRYILLLLLLLLSVFSAWIWSKQGGFHPMIVLLVATGRKNLRYCIRYSEKDLPMFTMQIYIVYIYIHHPIWVGMFVNLPFFFRFFMLLRDQQSRNSERCVVLVHPSMVLVHPSSYQQCFPWFCSAWLVDGLLLPLLEGGPGERWLNNKMCDFSPTKMGN
jgi:hypothetical protein